MTEAEWLACDDPVAMVESLERMVSDRRLRLLACACSRHLWGRISDDVHRKCVEAAEQFVEGTVNKNGLRIARRHAMRAPRGSRAQDGPNGAAVAAAFKSAYGAAYNAVLQVIAAEADHSLPVYRPMMRYLSEDWRQGRARGFTVGVTLLRDIFGNPFRPATFDPSWLTSTVVGLARGIYEEQAFDRMPILADALQDAGCDNEDVLSHCRGPGPHVRGCWVVDLVLGKE